MSVDSRRLDIADIVGVISLYLGARNLIENEQQSDAQLKILRQNDVGAANDRQAAYLLAALGDEFRRQNQMLEEILEKLEVLTHENHQKDGQADA